MFLCDSATGLSAQEGQVSSNLDTAYSVVSVLGNPAGGCPDHGIAPGAVTFPGLSAVPFGHHVWTNILVTKKTKTVRLLVCVLVNKHNGQPVPTPSPTIANPTASPSESVTQPTASPSESTAPPTDITGSGGTEAPTASPSGSPTVSQPTASPTGSPTVNPNGTTDLTLDGFTFRCRIVTKTISKNVVTFEAQDIDAPTVTPLAGDSAGVQTRTVHLPAGTVFDSAGGGIVQNLAALVPCSGLGFPAILAGPAAYTSRACQPVNVTEYATVAIAGGASQNLQALNAAEVIAPGASAAVIAPNNSIGTVNSGPHGTASDASTTGTSFRMFTGNATS